MAKKDIREKYIEYLKELCDYNEDDILTCLNNDEMFDEFAETLEEVSQ